MTTTTHTDDATLPIERKTAVEHLNTALEAEENGEKNYRIQEAL